jgi:hypothetical protein
MTDAIGNRTMVATSKALANHECSVRKETVGQRLRVDADKVLGFSNCG